MPVIDLLATLPAEVVKPLRQVVENLRVGNEGKSDLTELSFDTDSFMFTMKVDLRWRHVVALPDFLEWVSDVGQTIRDKVSPADLVAPGVKAQIELAKQIAGRMKDLATASGVDAPTIAEIDPSNFPNIGVAVGGVAAAAVDAAGKLADGAKSVARKIPFGLVASPSVVLFDTGMHTAIVRVSADSDDSTEEDDADHKASIEFVPPLMIRFSVDILHLDDILAELRKYHLPVDFKIPEGIAIGELDADFYNDVLKKFVERKTDKSDYQRRCNAFIASNGNIKKHCYFARQDKFVDWAGPRRAIRDATVSILSASPAPVIADITQHVKDELAVAGAWISDRVDEFGTATVKGLTDDLIEAIVKKGKVSGHFPPASPTLRFEYFTVNYRTWIEVKPPGGDRSQIGFLNETHLAFALLWTTKKVQIPPREDPWDYEKARDAKPLTPGEPSGQITPALREKAAPPVGSLDNPAIGTTLSSSGPGTVGHPVTGTSLPGGH